MMLIIGVSWGTGLPSSGDLRWTYPTRSRSPLSAPTKRCDRSPQVSRAFLPQVAFVSDATGTLPAARRWERLL